MLNTVQGWSLCLIFISVIWLYLMIRKGPVAAVGAAIALSFAFPVWIKVDIGGLPIDVRTAIACIAMLVYVVHREGRILSPLTLLDCCIALMCVSHIATDYFATGLTPILPFRAYGEWALPYVAGRYAIRDRNDLKWIAPWVAGVLLFLGVMSCIESLSTVNPFEVIFGNRPTELASRNAARLGLKRAFGPTTHPIFLGMVLAVLMPWLSCMWQSFESRKMRAVTAFAGLVGFAGAVCTVSRTPVISILVTAVLILPLKFKSSRWLFGITLMLAVAGFAAFPDEVMDTVSRWTGGGDRPWLIEVDGEAVVTSSSRTRLHVFGVYSEALVKAGLFGYGSEATDGFPLRIQNMESRVKSQHLFHQVDNAYILLTLRLGWLGGGCLVILFLTAIATGLSLHFDRPDQMFPGVTGCMLTAIAGFSLLMVFMSYDFGLPILWTIGVLSGLASARISECR